MIKIPPQARMYFFLAIFFLTLPSLASLYRGQTGKLLVATHRISEGVFYQSVIYIARHDFLSAQGFIINKPLTGTEHDLRLETLEAHFEKVDLPLFRGGPVSYPDLIFQGWPARTAQKLETFPRFPNLLLSGERLPRKGEQAPNDTRLFLGYAGWGPLQLNSEYLRGAWVVIDFDLSLIFDTPPEDIWREAARRAGIPLDPLPVL